MDRQGAPASLSSSFTSQPGTTRRNSSLHDLNDFIGVIFDYEQFLLRKHGMSSHDGSNEMLTGASVVQNFFRKV